MDAAERSRPAGLLLLVVGTLVAGCGVDPEPSGETPGASRSVDRMAAPAVFAQVEETLMEGGARSMEFDVRSEGVFTASLEGIVRLGDGNDLDLEASGVFGADSVSVWLDATEGVMAWSNAGEREEAALPAGLRESMVIGLTRMGVLHNLARLVSGAPPDRSDGSVRSWVEVEDPRWWEDDPPVGSEGISFGILVDGQSAGSATVWLDDSGIPLGREQVVAFPGGEMRVAERYRWNP